LQKIDQIHLVGGQDPIVSKEVVASYLDRFSSNPRPQMRVIPDFDHDCCWVEQWPDLAREIFP
jgi:hypothetical protein